MKVYVCSVWDGNDENEILLGVFSSLEKAEKAGRAYIDDASNGTADITDRDKWKNIRYYVDYENVSYIERIEETEIDQGLG